MRDFRGLNAQAVPTDVDNLEGYLPTLRADIDHLDYFLRDLSRGLHRIEVGQVPNGSGQLIVNQTVSDKYWYKPGQSPFGTAFMDTASAGTGIISSTSHATKGYVDLGGSTGLRYDETNVRVGLSQSAPTARLHMVVPPPVGQVGNPASDISTTGYEGVPDNTNLFNNLKDSSDGTYIRVIDNQNRTYTCGIATLTDPGIDTGHVMYFTLFKTDPAPTITVQLLVDIGGATIRSANQVITTTPTEYSVTLTTPEGAAFAGGYGSIRLSMAAPGGVFGGSGGGYVECSKMRFEVPAVGGGGSAETLQKWSTTSGTNLDQLDFGADGAGGTDLILSGNSELLMAQGDASTGLRLYSLSNSFYIEAGTTAQANMNLILGGNRASTGTLLTSNFTNHVFNGNVGIGATPTVALDVTGSSKFRADVISLTSNPSNWSIGSGMYLEVTPNAGGRFVRGIAGGENGRLVALRAKSLPFTLNYEDAVATAANRIRTTTGRNMTTRLDTLHWLVYDSTSARWIASDFITAGDETIFGIWTHNGPVTFDLSQGGTLTLSGDTTSSPNPALAFLDNSTGYTSKLQSVTDTANNSIYQLPALAGASDVVVMADLAQTLNAKTVNMKSDTASSGSSFFDITTTTKRMRFVLSGAVGNSNIVVANTAARAYTLGDVPGLAVMAGNGADPPAGGAIGKINLTGKTADVANTNWTDTTPTGIYILYVDLECTTSAVGAGTIAFRIDYTDDVGAVTNEVIVNRALTATGRSIGAWMIYLASGNLVYDITITGIYSTAVYAARARAIYLG